MWQPAPPVGGEREQQTPVYEKALAPDRGATVTAIDVAEGLLGIAHGRVPDADLRRGDMQALPFADDTFDLAPCLQPDGSCRIPNEWHVVIGITPTPRRLGD